MIKENNQHPLYFNTSLKKLGLNQWIKDKIDSAKSDRFSIARVVLVNKDSFLVKNEDEVVKAVITGKLMYGSSSSLDYPAVGDWVYVNYYDNNTFAIIHEIIPRKTILKRKTPGKKIDFQLIASNIDTAFIIQSLDTDFNLRRLERYLVMINEGNIVPVVLLSKSDLLPSDQIKKKISEIHYAIPNIKIIAFSNENHSGMDQIMELLISGQTYSLLGSSGVGKTTLLNNLLHGGDYKTRSVREKDGKGKHTTTNRQLIHLKNGAMVIDTPGMRELGNFDFETGLNISFDEITQLSNQCRFNNCKHIQENGCAVVSAVRDGHISEKRYQNYIKLAKESEYYEMSYLEKRQRDKQFGKMCKTVMKFKKKY